MCTASAMYCRRADKRLFYSELRVTGRAEGNRNDCGGAKKVYEPVTCVVFLS